MRFRLLHFVLLTLGTLPLHAATRYARNFDIENKNDYSLVTVVNTRVSPSESYRYALVPKGSKTPELPSDARIIRTPVERIVVMETTQVGYLNAINQLDRVVGAGSVDYINNTTILERIASGEIKRVQSGQQINAEQLLLLRPDLILTSVSGNPAYDIPEKLLRTGLPIVCSTSFMETHPLGRAEWVRFFGAFTDTCAEADTVFDTVADTYQALRQKTAASSKRPTVFCSAPYSGFWNMPSGDSYTARIIEDAGGDYLWSDTKTGGNIPLDVETVFLRAANASFWINPSHHRSMQQLFAADQRFEKFTAARKRQVYNNTRQTTEGGGNPIWEDGIVRPDYVLADLIHILHPDLLPEHDFVFYEQLK